MGWFSDIYDRAKSAVTNVYDSVKHTASNWLSGFRSAPGKYFFCGDGNRLDYQYVNENLPKANESDQACYAHDSDYENFKKAKDQGKISNQELKSLVRESDNRLISNLKKAKNRDVGSYLSEYGIRAKRWAEDWGFLDPGHFVT